MVEEYTQKIVLDGSSKRVFANVFSPKASGNVAVIPENIKKDVELLGVVGTYGGGDTPKKYPLIFNIKEGYLDAEAPAEIEEGAEITFKINANDGYTVPASISVSPTEALLSYDKDKGRGTLKAPIAGSSGSGSFNAIQVDATCEPRQSGGSQPSALTTFKVGTMPDGVDIDPAGLDSATLNSFIENVPQLGYLVTFGDPSSSGYGNSGIEVTELDTDSTGTTKVKILHIDLDSNYSYTAAIYSPQAFTAYTGGQEIGNVLQGWQVVPSSGNAEAIVSRNSFRIPVRYIGNISDNFAPLNGTCLGEYYK